MRFRRASTHARRLRPMALLGCLLATALAVPDVAAQPQAATVAPRQATSTATRVVDLAIPPSSDLTGLARGLGEAKAAGPLVARLRAPLPAGAAMLGVTWQRSTRPLGVTTAVRARVAGGWGDWTTLHADPDEGPAPGEAGADARDGTEPLWIGDADEVEVAVFSVDGAPVDLRLSAIAPGASPAGEAVAAKASALADTGKPGSFPTMPSIVTRKQWGADPRLGDECWDPKYGRTFKAVVVHHTAGSNDYTRREASAVVRGILAYHTQSRGWCDIGYNFLVDRYGTIYEGRAGGIRQPVRGAHAGDYNVNTTGVSLMGNFETAKPTRAMKDALVRLISWRLGTAYHGPFGKTFVFDHKISRISGHRDVMSTACPGKNVYQWLPRLRHLVADRLGDHTTAIERYWTKQGGAKGPLGPVRIGEQAGQGGHHTAFTKGRVYLSAHGRHTLYKGPLLKRYLKAGETRGPLGYPRTNQHEAADGRGVTADFDGGRIYWSKATGSTLLRRGKVLKKYREVRGPGGRLGFPTSQVYDLRRGSRAEFQHGTITFSKTKREVIVRYR